MTECIYKLFRAAEWESFQKTAVFEGSPDDLRDGFIHFSAAHQVRATFDKYFHAEPDPVLAAVDSDRVKGALQWEVSRGGQKFPHLYAPLQRADVQAIFKIGKDASGRPIFPAEIP